MENYMRIILSHVLILMNGGHDFRSAFSEAAHRQGIFWGADSASYNFHFQKIKGMLAASRRSKRKKVAALDPPAPTPRYFDRQMAAAGEREEE